MWGWEYGHWLLYTKAHAANLKDSCEKEEKKGITGESLVSRLLRKEFGKSVRSHETERRDD